MSVAVQVPNLPGGLPPLTITPAMCRNGLSVGLLAWPNQHKVPAKAAGAAAAAAGGQAPPPSQQQLTPDAAVVKYFRMRIGRCAL